MQQIDFVNAPGGAGKTYGATDDMKARVVRGEKIILVQLLNRLICETVETTFTRLGIDPSHVTEISERTRLNGGITKAVIDHINNAVEGRGEILVITHAAFVRLAETYASFRDGWTVIIDEALDVQEAFSFKLPDTHAFVTEHLEITRSTDPSYWAIGKKIGSRKLDDIARNRGGDEVYERMQPFASAVVSKHRIVYVQAARYNALITKADVHGVPRRLDAFSVLNPSVLKGWRQVIVIAANFTDTLMYLLWSRMFAKHVVFRDITSTFSLRYTEHGNGHLLDIDFAYDGRWSKTFANKEIAGDAAGRTHRDAFVDAVHERVGDQPIAVLANNGHVGVEKCFVGGVRLPPFAHGLNTFQHLDAAVLLLAANPKPDLIAFLKHIADLSDDEVFTAFHQQVIYQGALRISLRDPDSMTRKTLYVPDRSTAEYLHILFPGSRLHRLELGLPEHAVRQSQTGRPKIYASGPDRQRAYRERQDYEKAVRLERELRLKLVNGCGIADRDVAQATLIAETMEETLNIADTTIDCEKFHGTYFDADLHENVGHVEPCASFDGVVADFRDLSQERHARKEDCWLWSPAYFVPITRNDNPQGKRCGYVNMAYARHIILDNDGGDLSPEQFAALFPGLRMMIYSTWSSTATLPKWRVIIETDHVLDIEGYALITARIIALLNDQGYFHADEIGKDPAVSRRKDFMGAHGFDRSKLNPVARLFVPSLGAYPADAFFHDFAGGQRAALPVFDWIEMCPVPERPAILPVRSPTAPTASNPKADPRLQRLQAALFAQQTIKFVRKKEFRIEAALDWWTLEGDRAGQRDRNFCRLAGRLRRAGCDQSEFEVHLTAAAVAARRSSVALKGKIPRLWKMVTR